MLFRSLLLDLVKGTAAVLIGRMLVNGGGEIAGVMAFIGHCYPVWLRFAGGKGVATMMGVVLALYWPSGLVFALVWLGMLAALRWSSVGGMSAAVSAPVSVAAFGHIEFLPPMLAMALLVLWRHRANIARLIKGEEPKVGSKKSTSEQAG